MSQRPRWMLPSGLRDRDGSCPMMRPGLRNWSPRWWTWVHPGAVLEATGGLELPLVAALTAEALPVAVVVVNPRQVRDFAWATGTLAKTDALDAAVLAHFADAVRPSVRPLRDAETQVLNSLAARRRQVDHAGLGEESPHRRHRRRPPPHQGPYCLAEARVGRPAPERSAGVLPITGGSGAKARYRWADPPEGRHCGRGGLAITASLCEVVGGLFWFALILYVYVMGLRALPEKLASCLKCATCDKICEHTGATTAT